MKIVYIIKSLAAPYGTERILIDNLAAGQTATVMGEITKSKLIRTWKKKMLITECFVTDDTGTVRAVPSRAARRRWDRRIWVWIGNQTPVAHPRRD